MEQDFRRLYRTDGDRATEEPTIHPAKTVVAPVVRVQGGKCDPHGWVKMVTNRTGRGYYPATC
jgi:hypothetical protein